MRNISDKKIKNLALKIVGDLQPFETPSDVYVLILELVKTQKDYFVDYLGLPNVIKLIIYIWSLNQTSKFDLGENILEKMKFVVLLVVHDDMHEEDCNYCEGSGRVDCSDCDARGTDTCDNCDGDGTTPCDECEGIGKIEDEEGDMVECPECSGEKEFTCTDCGGSGESECSSCGGSGMTDCPECDGDGYLKTDENYYTYSYLITWNDYLNSQIGLNLSTDEPLMNKENLIDYDQEYILTKMSNEGHSLFNNWVETDVYYTLDSDDEPKLVLDAETKIKWVWDITKMDGLTK